MIFSREYIGYLAKRTVKHLIDAKMLRTDKPAVLNERVTNGLVEELSTSLDNLFEVLLIGPALLESLSML